MSCFSNTDQAHRYLFQHNQFFQDQYQRDSQEVETMIAVTSQADNLFQLNKFKRDPIHYIFIIDDPLFLEYAYFEQFKYFILGYTQKKNYIIQEEEQENRDIFSIYFSFCQDKNEDFATIVSAQLFSCIQNENQFYQIFNQQVLRQPEIQKYISPLDKIYIDQNEENPSNKILQVFNLAFKECTDLSYNNSIIFVSSMMSTTSLLQIERQLSGLQPNDQYMFYNFKLHVISLRNNSFDLLQKITSSTLGFYFYANDILKQILLYSLDQIQIHHTKPYLKNYRIELHFDDRISLINQVSPCSKWTATYNSGKNQSYEIQQKYFYAKEEKISLVSLILNPTQKFTPGTYKIGSVTHSFQLPSQRKRISLISDVIITLTNESTYKLNPECVIFYEQCIFIQFGFKILQSLLQFNWAQVDQLLPRIREVFSIYKSDSVKYQNLLRSTQFLLQRVAAIKQSFSHQSKNFISTIQRETIPKEECYNQIYKMIEYLHNINHFLINLG